MVSANDPWIAAISALLTGGVAKFGYDVYKDWRGRPTAAQRHVSTIDASIVTVARARDELEEDNTRLRNTHAEERKSWDEERARYENDRRNWQAERASLKSEVDALEQKIRDERAESTRRYDALLLQVNALSINRGEEGKR